MRIASLVGRLTTGDLVTLGLADSVGINRLVAKYHEITAAGGKIADVSGRAVKGKQETHLSEMYLLANNTGGGELKARRRFNHPAVVV